MLKKLFLPFCMILSLIACRKMENGDFDLATLTGQDLRLCACCGGWFIKIDTTTWRFDTAPAKSEVDLNTVTYPLDILLKWHKKEPACLGDEIIVEEIKTP